jgi:hypothetical protein
MILLLRMLLVTAVRNRPTYFYLVFTRVYKKRYYFSVTSTKVGELNSIFTLNSNMFLVFLYHGRFLSDIQL